MIRISTFWLLLVSLSFVAPASGQPSAVADDEAQTNSEAAAEPTPVELADGDLKFEAPAEWEKVKPRNRIIEVELRVPPIRNEDDENGSGESEAGESGRLTVMGAGGSIGANVARWKRQFTDVELQDDGEPAKVSREERGRIGLTIVDMTGSYLSRPRGPRGPVEEKPNHRMLAAIAETPNSGNYFFKFIGPAELVEARAEGFYDLVRSLELTE